MTIRKGQILILESLVAATDDSKTSDSVILVDELNCEG